jgi:hypothetical protein
VHARLAVVLRRWESGARVRPRGRQRRLGQRLLGGTSVAAPVVGGVHVLGGVSGVAGANTVYSHTSSLNDVSGGSNGSCGGSYLCTAVTGYDGPTGLGTPAGAAAF